MFRFANPEYLYLLLILPVLVLIFIIGNIRYRKRLAAFGDVSMLQALMPDKSNTKRVVRFWLMFSSVAFICMLLARPQFGSSQTTVRRMGIETVIALDVSNSMLAQDVAPSRLEKSKRLISSLVDDFQDDKVGLVLFAGDAYVQIPITSDFISAKLFLSTISTQSAMRQGTNIKDALNLCMKSFTAQENIGRAIILITDGENHEDGALEAAKMVKEKGYSLYVLGVGSTQGSPLSTDGGNSYKKDKDGQVIITRLNESMCKELAQAGAGKYFYVDNSNAAERALKKEISQLAKADIESTIYAAWNEQFWIVAIIILVLLLLEMFMSERESLLIKTLKKRNLLTLVILFALPGITQAQYSDRDYVRKGNRLYSDSLFLKAETKYLQAIDANPQSISALYNLCNTYIDQDKMKESVGKIDTVIAFQKERIAALSTEPGKNSKDIEKTKKQLSMSYHNKGIVRQAGQDLDGAIEAYKESLRLNPSDDETRYNLLRAMYERQKQQEQQQQQQQNQNKNQNQQQNQNQDQNQDQNQNQDQQQNQDQNQNQDQQQNQDQKDQKNDQNQDQQQDQKQDQDPSQQPQDDKKDEEKEPEPEEDKEDQEIEATLKKAQERNDEHEAEKKARMRKAPLPPNERDW